MSALRLPCAHGQTDDESRPLPRQALDLNATAVGIDGMLDQEQSQTAALAGTGFVVFDPEKLFKDGLMMFRGDAPARGRLLSSSASSGGTVNFQLDLFAVG